MKNIDRVVIANQDHQINNAIVRMLKDSGFSGIIKCTLNAGHALLYLDHLSLEGKLFNSKVLVLLNPNTPIVNGLEFLSSFQDSTSIQKENIRLIILTDNMNSDIVERSRKKGARNFLPFSFAMADLDEVLYGVSKPDEKKKEKSKVRTSKTDYARI